MVNIKNFNRNLPRRPPLQGAPALALRSRQQRSPGSPRAVSPAVLPALPPTHPFSPAVPPAVSAAVLGNWASGLPLAGQPGLNLRGRTVYDNTRDSKKGSENQGAPKERRRGRAEKRLSKRVFLESPFLLCSLKVLRTFQVVLRGNLKGAEKKRTLQKHPFGQPFLRTTPSPLLWRALREGSGDGSEEGFLEGACYGFYSKRVLRRVLRKGFRRGIFQKGPRTP